MTIQDVAAQTGIDEADIRRLCTENRLEHMNSNGTLLVFESEIGKLQQIHAHPHLRRKLEVLDSSFMYDYHPHLTEYLCYHSVFDIFTWLLKVRYSPRDVIRSRAFHLPELFEQFLSDVAFDLRKLRKLIGSQPSEERFIFHLNKGWYNELVRSVPLSQDFLRIGPRTDPENCQGRSVAWNITQSYYSVYEYVNALVFTDTKTLRTEEHRKSTRYFHNHLLEKYSNKLIPYPFNITSPLCDTMDNLRGARRSFWSARYANYPRSPYKSKSIFHLEDDMVELLEDDATFLDFFYKFRVWANYLGINTIVALEDGYFLSHLYKNLGLLCFFYGCFTEIMGLALLGEAKLVELARDLAFKHIHKQDAFKSNLYLVPMFLRFRLYRKHGLISDNLDFTLPAIFDPLAS
jgi:hypothetical protein